MYGCIRQRNIDFEIVVLIVMTFAAIMEQVSPPLGLTYATNEKKGRAYGIFKKASGPSFRPS